MYPDHIFTPKYLTSVNTTVIFRVEALYRIYICHLFHMLMLIVKSIYLQTCNIYVIGGFVHLVVCLFVCLMVFNATFNNISVISWRSVLLVDKNDKLYRIMLYTSPWSRFELTPSVAIGTDCIGSCKSNDHTITATTTPLYIWELSLEMLFPIVYYDLNQR